MKNQQKQPPMFVSHVYDIDIFDILDRFKEKYKSSQLAPVKITSHLKTLKEIENKFVKVKRKEGIGLKLEQKYRHYVISCTETVYPTFLAFKLLISDPFKIPAILSYQSVLFLGNYYAAKDNFIGLIEFNVYNILKSADFLNESIRLEKIANWLENNRKFILVNAYNAKVVTMEADFANILVQRLHPYFDESQHADLFNVVFKDTSINEKLIFKGSLIELADLFKRLRANRKIVVKSNEILAQWLCDKFGIEKNIKEGKLKEINKGVLLNYLVRDSRIPKGKASIICEDIAPVISKKLK